MNKSIVAMTSSFIAASSADEQQACSCRLRLYIAGRTETKRAMAPRIQPGDLSLPFDFAHENA
jgi:hypothetical protein